MTLPASCVSSEETEAEEGKRCRGYECEDRGERRERVEGKEEGECGEEKGRRWREMNMRERWKRNQEREGEEGRNEENG